jgi:hypothetical protein
MPTGWRPADVEARFPDKKIENPYNFEKYAPIISKPMLVWIWFQFIFTFGMLFYFYGNIAKLGMPNMFVYGGFIYLTVFAYTELMDRNRYAIIWEIIKNIIGFALIYQMGDWFGSSSQYSWSTAIMMVYFVLSTIITAYFVKFEISEEIEKVTLA